MSKYLLILFFASCLFFLGVELCYFFFFFSFHVFLFFFSFGVALFFFFFRCWTFSFFFLGGCRICSSCFWSLFLVSNFLGPCVFSLSLSIAWTSRPEIDSSLFLAASLIVFVEPWQPNRKPYHERYAQVLAANMSMLRSHIHEYGHVQNWHVMFITIEYIKNRNLKNT